MPPTLTQAQRESITAALFRREDAKYIADTHSISERQVRRIHQNLRFHGTVNAPRMKKMGRPNVLSKEVEDDLKGYILMNPLALLEEMQTYIQSKFNVKCSRASLSRRVKELGFTRGANLEAFRTDDPQLSQVDYEHLLNDTTVDQRDIMAEESGPGLGNSKKSKYMWVLHGDAPLSNDRRHDGDRIKKQRGMVGSGKGHKLKIPHRQRNDRENHQRDMAVQPDLEEAAMSGQQEDIDLQILGNVASQSPYALPIVGQHNDIPQQYLSPYLA